MGIWEVHINKRKVDVDEEYTKKKGEIKKKEKKTVHTIHAIVEINTRLTVTTR